MLINAYKCLQIYNDSWKFLPFPMKTYHSLPIFTNAYQSYTNPYLCFYCLQMLTNLCESLPIFTNPYESYTNHFLYLLLFTNAYKSLEILTNP